MLSSQLAPTPYPQLSNLPYLSLSLTPLCVAGTASNDSKNARGLFQYNITGGFFGFFFIFCIQHCFISRLSDSTVSEDADIEPRTVATSALAVRRSNHARLDLIHPVLTIYAPMIYTAPCIMLWMRAYPLRGEVGGGWALEFSSFFGPCKMASSRQVSAIWGPKTREYQGPNPSHFPK